MAEGIRKIAKALYERGSGEERKDAEEFYERFVLEGDKEYGKRRDIPSNEEISRKLGSINTNGALSFEDALLVFYYNKYEINILRCYACHELIFGPCFSCLECLSNSTPNSRRRALCCDCYGGGQSIYHDDHPRSSTPTPLLHDQQLVLNLTRLTTAQGEMEELQKIAMLQYKAASPEVQELALEFFKCMDTDGDGKVDVEEYLSFMAEQGCGAVQNRQFFNQLDVDSKGSLDFNQVMTLYYVIKSGRPNCDRCGDFIPGIFFSCVFCFRARSSFSLCQTCYFSAACIHNHNGKYHFLDNYTLLETIREPPVAHDDQAESPAEPPLSTKTVRASGKKKRDVAFKALELAILFIDVTGTEATSCTIS